MADPRLPLSRAEYTRVASPNGESKAKSVRMVIALSASMLLASSASFVGATVYGDDERVLPEAMLTSREVALYGDTQMVVCEAPGSESHGAAGTIATDFMHGVTIAHVFYDT